VRAGADDASIAEESRAHPGPEGDSDGAVVPRRCSDGGLAEKEGVGVVGDVAAVIRSGRASRSARPRSIPYRASNFPTPRYHATPVA
jgi:hypothetical protein